MSAGHVSRELAKWASLEPLMEMLMDFVVMWQVPVHEKEQFPNVKVYLPFV